MFLLSLLLPSSLSAHTHAKKGLRSGERSQDLRRVVHSLRRRQHLRDVPHQGKGSCFNIQYSYGSLPCLYACARYWYDLLAIASDVRLVVAGQHEVRMARGTGEYKEPGVVTYLDHCERGGGCVLSFCLLDVSFGCRCLSPPLLSAPQATRELKIMCLKAPRKICSRRHLRHLPYSRCFKQ